MRKSEGQAATTIFGHLLCILLFLGTLDASKALNSDGACPICHLMVAESHMKPVGINPTDEWVNMSMAAVSPQILMESAYRSVMLYNGQKELEMQCNKSRLMAQGRQKYETMQEKFSEKLEQACRKMAKKSQMTGLETKNESNDKEELQDRLDGKSRKVTTKTSGIDQLPRKIKMRCDLCCRELEGQTNITTCGQLLCTFDESMVLSSEGACPVCDQLLSKREIDQLLRKIKMRCDLFWRELEGQTNITTCGQLLCILVLASFPYEVFSGVVIGVRKQSNANDGDGECINGSSPHVSSSSSDEPVQRFEMGPSFDVSGTSEEDSKPQRGRNSKKYDYKPKRINVYVDDLGNYQLEKRSDFTLRECRGYLSFAQEVKGCNVELENVALAHVCWPWAPTYSRAEYFGTHGGLLDPLTLDWHDFASMLECVVLKDKRPTPVAQETLALQVREVAEFIPFRVYKGEEIEWDLSITRSVVGESYTTLRKVLYLYVCGIDDTIVNDKDLKDWSDMTYDPCIGIGEAHYFNEHGLKLEEPPWPNQLSFTEEEDNMGDDDEMQMDGEVEDMVIDEEVEERAREEREREEIEAQFVRSVATINLVRYKTA